MGRSFFTPPSGRVVSLGDGMDLWVGLFQSAVLGWKPFLNIDGLQHLDIMLILNYLLNLH